ncbi:ABC transporter permease [Candidatus Uhrbacteria bacterium]|nr:ABC transporter permease [Candidatus Uhrbacteria bacterium]
MKFHRINGLLIRHLYLYRRSFPRLADLFYWPVMDILLWGFISAYLEKLHLFGFNAVTVLLGAMIFWDLLSNAQRTVSIAFLEETWERNLLNIFVTPLSVAEFLASTFVLSLIRIMLVGGIMGLLSFFLYHLNILQFGYALIPFVVNLLFFGWTLGLFTTGLILRYGTSAQILAFGFILLIQPFSAVFYPISSLPGQIQWIAYLFPSTYIFEGMRQVAASGEFSTQNMLSAIVTNAIYGVFTLWYFYYCFNGAKKRAALMRLD